MTNNSTTSPALQSEAETAVPLLDDWFDPIEAGLRERVREFIQAMIESELEAALSRPRYGATARPSGSLSDPTRCRVRHHHLRPAHEPGTMAAGAARVRRLPATVGQPA